MSGKIYIDYAATTPLDDDVLKVMKPYFSEKFYNPSANYLDAKKLRKEVDEARKKVAFWLGAKQTEIIFTAGGTEANNLAINGIMQKYPEAEILVSSVEHDSVLIPTKKYASKQIKVDKTGRIDLEDLKKRISDKTVLVSVIYANSEIGTIEPIKDVAKIVNAERSRRKNELPIYLHTDACQAANYLDLHVSRLGVDLLTINGGKIYGPKQSGFLFVKSGIKINPQIFGGGQERGIRSGTENVPAIIGLSEALDKAQKMKREESERLSELQAYFFDQLQKSISKALVNGSLKNRLPNNLHFTLPGEDNERLLFALDEEGIMAAAGSACSASSDTPSHVLKAIGLSDEEARSSLRFSMGRSSKRADIDRIIHSLKKFTS